MISESRIETIPEATIKVLHSVKYFIVERARTARRFIKSTHPPYRIDELNIVEFQKDDRSAENQVLEWLNSGFPVGVISESGAPGIADPGNSIVLMAHQRGFKVNALVGPSSINLALSASGLNGQNFAFHGYLPIKDNELRKKLNSLEKTILATKETQIFIETPYRNNRLIKNILKFCSSKILFCIACDLTGDVEFVQTRTIGDWNKEVPQLEKLPTIFLLGI